MNTRNSRSGSAVVIAIVFTIVLSIILFSLINLGVTQKRLNLRHERWLEARNAVEALLEYGAGDLRARLSNRVVFADDALLPGNEPLMLPPQNPGGGAIDIFANSNVVRSSLLLAGGRVFGQVVEVIPPNANDPLRGQTVTSRGLRLFARATATRPNGESSTVYGSALLRIRSAGWIDGLGKARGDLEIAPGPLMYCTERVSGMRNLYVQSNTGLNFCGDVIAQGSLFHGRKAGIDNKDGLNYVKFSNESGMLIDMNQNGTWIDSRLANFEARARELWDGRVMTGSMGAEIIDPPGFSPFIPDDPATPANELQNGGHSIIEKATPFASGTPPSLDEKDREAAKLATKACIVITANGNTIKAYKYQSGSGPYVRLDGESIVSADRVEVTLPAGLVTRTTMIDKRRSATAITMYDVDLGVLRTALSTADQSKAIKGFSAAEWNGVIFVETASPTTSGVRMVNAAVLPRVGTIGTFTAGADTALYTKGNFNADGVIPSLGSNNTVTEATAKAVGTPEKGELSAALAGDSITVLSTSWNDSKSNADLSNRTATPTEVSAAFLTGSVPTNDRANARYSGGFENFPRFLENWNGVPFAYRGAMLSFFQSTVDASLWGSNNVYNPPVRVWGFNTRFKTVQPVIVSDFRELSRSGYTEYANEAEFDAALAAAQN